MCHKQFVIKVVLGDDEQRKARDKVGAPRSEHPPIHITNVIPPQGGQASALAPTAESASVGVLNRPAPKRRLILEGPRDKDVLDYFAWHATFIEDTSRKRDYDEAAKYMLNEHFDLKFLYEVANDEFMDKCGFKQGVAWRLRNDLEGWVQKSKRGKFIEAEEAS